MGGQRRGQFKRDEQTIDPQHEGAEDFGRRLDELTFSSTRSSIAQAIPVEDSEISPKDVEIDKLKRELEKQREQLIQKDIALKEIECESLRRENVLLNQTLNDRIIANPATQFVFRDIEESLTKFSGDDHYPIQKWIADVEEAAVCMGWSDLQTTIYAKRLLVGTAKQSLALASNTSTWPNLTKFLTEEFQKSENSAVIHRRMAERRKKPDESHLRYLIELSQLGKTGQIKDDAIIQYCIDGITDIEINKAILYGASNMVEFKKKLEIYEEIKRKSMRTATSSYGTATGAIPKTKFRKESLSPLKCYSCGSVGHIARNCNTKEKGPRCFKCGEYGHVSTKCTKEAKVCAAIQEGIFRSSNDVKKIIVEGRELYAMVDNGSDLNFMAKNKYLAIGEPGFVNQTTTFNGAGSKGLSTLGRFYTKVKVDVDEFNTLFHIVADDLLPADIILGKELINQTITVLSPVGITMKKFDGQDYLKSIQHDEISLELSHIKDKKISADIRKMVVNYNPKQKSNIKSDIEMKIILTDDKPIYQKPRRLSPLELEITRRQIDDWLEEGIIRPSKSCFTSPIVLANKKDGSKRLCVDYRKLNKVIVKDRYPLPLIEDQIDQLQGAKLFSTLDLRNGFFHVPIAEESIKYTSFIVPFGQFQFLKTPFGLCNSPAVFQRFINNIFNPLSFRKIVCVYMDDLVIPAKDEEESVQRLSMVLKVAEENGLEIKCRCRRRGRGRRRRRKRG